MRDPSPPPPYSENDPYFRVLRRQPSAPVDENEGDFSTPQETLYPSLSERYVHQGEDGVRNLGWKSELVEFGPYPVRMTCQFCEVKS